MDDLENEKINTLLSYWITHNNQHCQEIEKWTQRLKKSISKDTLQDLKGVIKLFGKMNAIYESVKEKLAMSTMNEAHKTAKIKEDEPLISKWHGFKKKIEFQEIGTIHTPYKENAPYQPVEEDEGDFQIILNPKYKQGLHRLEEFNYIYVIYFIHQITKPMENIISPSWTNGIKVGIFASRSPVRPNPIGISIIKIKKIENNIIFISGLDVFDGTPLLDIKPYIKELDSKEDANYGWIEGLENHEHLLLHLKGIPHDY